MSDCYTMIHCTERECLLGQSVSGTRYQSKQLRSRVEKVDHLRYEEEQHCLTKVTQYANHSECHASKIAVGVSHEHPGRIPARCVHRALYNKPVNT